MSNTEQIDYANKRKQLVELLQNDKDFDFVVSSATVDGIMQLFVTSKLSKGEK